MNLDERQLGTVLAALRNWQHFLVLRQTPQDSDAVNGLLGIATDTGSFAHLDLKEIDALCEQLNFGDEETPDMDATTEEVLVRPPNPGRGYKNGCRVGDLVTKCRSHVDNHVPEGAGECADPLCTFKVPGDPKTYGVFADVEVREYDAEDEDEGEDEE